MSILIVETKDCAGYRVGRHTRYRSDEVLTWLNERRRPIGADDGEEVAPIIGHGSDRPNMRWIVWMSSGANPAG